MAETARRTQEERIALSDRRMTEAAILLLIEHGVEGTTLAAIGERAGYSRGLATQRFGSKAALFAHVYDQVVAIWVERVQRTVGTRVGPDALRRIVKAIREFIAEDPNEIRVMYLLNYASIDPGSEFKTNVAHAHRAQRRDVQRWIEGGQRNESIRRQINAALAAELFCASIDGIVYRWLADPTVPVRRMLDMLGAQFVSLIV